MNYSTARRVLSLFAASCALLFGTAAFAQPPQPIFTPFHANGIYALPDTVGWTVTLPSGAPAPTGSFTYTIRRNNLDVLKTGSFDLSSGTATIQFPYSEPAMLYVSVNQVAAPSSTPLSAPEVRQINDGLKALLADKDSALKPVFDRHPDLEILPVPQPSSAPTGELIATLGAAVAPTSLPPSAPRPADFDAFWAAKLNALKKVPIHPVITATPTTQAGVELYTVTLDNLGSHVHGYLAKPKGKGKFPVLIIYQWAGVYALQSSWATNRAAEGWMVFDVDSHDMAPDQDAGAPKDYNAVGNTSRETSYFLNMYLRDTRALDFVSTLPSWDRKTIVMTGTSMGGQQSLVTAGLNPGRVTAVVVNEPSGADSNGELHGRRTGYPFWPSADPQVMKTALYFDTVNFASHIKAPTLLAVGFIDTVAPPVGIWTAFDQIPGPKEIVPMIESDHNNITPQKQGDYLQRAEEVLATVLHGGKFIPNAGSTLPRP